MKLTKDDYREAWKKFPYQWLRESKGFSKWYYFTGYRFSKTGKVYKIPKPVRADHFWNFVDEMNERYGDLDEP
jgi:hypothetical protein